MKVELISIGDELLIGQTINTNASWLGQEFSKRGFDVANGVTIKDDREAILEAISIAEKRADIIIITGGLGPTKDDITKHVLCEHFETSLRINEEVLERVKAFFTQWDREMLDVNIQQANLPEAAKILQNDNGTASGMWFDKNSTITISLPGVPYEMKHLMTDRVFPALEKLFVVSSLYFRTIQFQGIGESYLADKIQVIENDMRSAGYSLAYLPKPGQLRLRLAGDKSAKTEADLQGYIDRMELLLPEYMFAKDDQSLNFHIGSLLVDKGLTVGTVESCTGGGIASEFVSISGSSRYFKGSIVSYTNELKSELVNVNSAHFNNVGAVSEEVVSEMASNGRTILGVDYCIATSGIAGPDGGTKNKPIGTVWIAVAGPSRVITKKFQFGNNRERNIEKAKLTGLNLLRCEVLQIKIEKS